MAKQGQTNDPGQTTDQGQTTSQGETTNKAPTTKQDLTKQDFKQDLEGLTAVAKQAAGDAAKTNMPGKALPPVHLWNPPFCGDLDMRIASDGTWFYMGTPIGRPALVRLFSTILKREGPKHFLVTPVEKVGIQVDDAPFLAVEMQKEHDAQEEGGGLEERGQEEGQRGTLLRFRTNVDDWVNCDSHHRLRFEPAADGGLAPYLHVRAGLWAKVTRALYYDLVDMGEERMVDGREMFGVTSAGEFFPMADAEQVRAAR
jgi:uncharacterized protein